MTLWNKKCVPPVFVISSGPVDPPNDKQPKKSRTLLIHGCDLGQAQD